MAENSYRHTHTHTQTQIKLCYHHSINDTIDQKIDSSKEVSHPVSLKC